MSLSEDAINISNQLEDLKLQNNRIEKNFPVKTKNISKLINNIQTDIVISSFSNQIFITISQNQKFNTWIQGYKQESTFSDEPCYTVETLLGNNQDQLLMIYARQLIENIGQSSNKTLLLSISIQDKSKDTFKIIMQTLFENKVW
ncbi:proteasome assembly chaperone 3 [Tieghemostelium lacteum]|uniref:Proteasome assembly chaperone 3 n=1 Tax=Tieghemostelium lacteum TaxID=361077 RepID=A0A152A5Z3_TIELA|nr:proteasome assembly chaperone 3 [Tieghemostelium lacteum]|eukprot:KYR01656.1 proteasome assembly chaperone 3 [Tieghemostelium lacteum]